MIPIDIVIIIIIEKSFMYLIYCNFCTNKIWVHEQCPLSYVLFIISKDNTPQDYKTWGKI